MIYCKLTWQCLQQHNGFGHNLFTGDCDAMVLEILFYFLINFWNFYSNFNFIFF